MKPERPRLLALQETICPRKSKRVRARNKKRPSLSMTATAFDFGEPLSLRIGEGGDPGRAFSEEPALVEESPRLEEKAPPVAVRKPASSGYIEERPRPADPVNDEKALEDLRSVSAHHQSLPAPDAPFDSAQGQPPAGMVRAHDVFDRMSRGEPPPPAPEEERDRKEPAAPSRSHAIFDQMDLSRAATFDAGSFAVEQTLDRFDRLLESKAPPPPPPPAEAQGTLEELDAVEDVATIVESLKPGKEEAPSGAKDPSVEALTAEGIRYVSDVDSHGWLKIKWEDGTTYPDVLPFQLKIEVAKIEGGREHFTVKEGLLKGKKGSVKLKSGDGASYLSKTGEHKSAASLELDLASATITIKDVGTYSAELDTSNPIPKGTYDLEVPYEIHHLADRYLTDSAFATTWFRIGHSGDRFLHPGSVSAGCATVLDHKEWTKIYNHLVRSRKDDQSVGTLVVK